MQEPNGLDPAERELEDALRTLSPASVRIDPVAAAFAAGRQSVRRQTQLWRSIAAVVSLIGAGVWFLPGRTNDGDRFRVSIAVASQPPTAAPAQSLVMLQHTVRHQGVDALPQTPIPTVRTIRANDVL
jgi:hypothetical protein